MAATRHETRRIKDVLRDADLVRRESERIRRYAEDVMRHRPFWPERRHDARNEEPSSANDDARAHP